MLPLYIYIFQYKYLYLNINIKKAKSIIIKDFRVIQGISLFDFMIKQLKSFPLEKAKQIFQVCY